MFGRKQVEARLARIEAAQHTAMTPAGLDSFGAALAGHTEWLKAIEHGLNDIRAALAPLQNRSELDLLRQQAAHHTEWLQAVEHGLADIRSSHDAQLSDLGRWLAATTHTVSSLSSTPVIPSADLQAIGPQAHLVDNGMLNARMLQVWAVMRWLDHAHFESDTLISVIIPTRNRRPYLARAIASVLAQRHTLIELIVVDDGSTDDTGDLLASIADPRLRSLRTSGIGASAARNLGLDAVRGAIVTHLDDDNLMDPGWLRGVAWAFSRWSDTNLLYGARIVEDGPARNRAPSGAMPALEFLPFDRARLEQSNYIDMNVIAHRAGPDARFDPALRSSIEWDFLLRLTAEHAPLELPLIACLYSNYAPNRLSDRATYLDENRLVRARVHTTRPLRVLSYNAMFPLMSETYIEEEMLALEAAGAQIAFAAFTDSVSPYTIRQPIYAGLDAGIAAHDPDVVFVYWASHAAGELEHLARAGRPFALRVHSFDFDIGLVTKVAEHPLCVGIWAFPHQADLLPGAHALVPIFSTHVSMPAPAPVRNVVASVSAGLPKKDWPLLLEAMDRLSAFERVVVLARSNGLEHVPDEVERQASAYARPPSVKINMPRQEVFDLLARTSALLYTVKPGLALGMPMSVIEGLSSGACVITPDRPEMRALCGEGFRPYSNVADIVAHVHDIMAGGPAIEAERRRNRDSALARFCAPDLGVRFHADLSAAITAWRMRRQLA